MQSFALAALYHGLELIDRRGLGEILGGAANLQPGAFRERHLANTINSTHCCH